MPPVELISRGVLARPPVQFMCVKRCRAIIPCFFPRSVTSPPISLSHIVVPRAGVWSFASPPLSRPARSSHPIAPPFPRYSHKYTLPAATRVRLAAIDIHILLGTAVGSVAASGGVAGHLLIVAPDLADDIVEGVVDVDARLRRGLDELAAE